MIGAVRALRGRRPGIGIPAAGLALLWACTGRPEVERTMPTHPLTLYVSNQSFEATPVDVEVRFDGEVVLSREFEVGSDVQAQHRWQEFSFPLESGEHRIEVFSRRGEARLEEAFEIDGPRWATLAYWSGSRPGEAAHFTLEFSERPIGFY